MSYNFINFDGSVHNILAPQNERFICSFNVNKNEEYVNHA
jgi:hypothetical protein